MHDVVDNIIFVLKVADTQLNFHRKEYLYWINNKEEKAP